MTNILASLLVLLSTFIPRQEYPRPQFEREEWVNLNGDSWTCELDPANSGVERKLYQSTGFTDRITVPFCPESTLSGLGLSNDDFITGIWYHRNIDIPESWTDKNVILNFGAVYYKSEIYIDGKFVCRHFGGSDSFSVDITDFVQPGKSHSLVVNAESDLRSRMQPAGKQALRVSNFECTYTRTTGIWQTVWMEPVEEGALDKVKVLTDIDKSQVSFSVTSFSKNGYSLSIKIYDSGKLVATSKGPLTNGSIFTIPLKKAKLWEPGSPFLYDVIYEVSDASGAVRDRVKSYFGMRKINIDGKRIYLNNKPLYQRLVLDQGYYPDGIWTASSDEAIKKDIELAMSCGFNGARLHQKIFEERYHYWADRLGFLTWGEFPSWGVDLNSPQAQRNIISEWLNVVERDANHPSIIVWCPLNEAYWADEVSYPRFVSDMYYLTKMLDNTRPVNTTSGGLQVVTDIWSVHSYVQDPVEQWEKLYAGGKMFCKNPIEKLQKNPRGNVGFNSPMPRNPFVFPSYDGSMPYMLDEWGGMKCKETNKGEGLWGYGKDPETIEEYYQRLEAHVRMLTENSDCIWGWCFTQLTDVEQEQNGIFYFDRSTKFDTGRLKNIFTIPIRQ